MSEGNGISNRPGPASAAEPSMEEILASIRRILSEEEARPASFDAAALDQSSFRQAPLTEDFDEDAELVLDASMRVAPALVESPTLPPQPESESSAGSLGNSPFSSGPGLDSQADETGLEQGFMPASVIEPLPLSAPADLPAAPLFEPSFEPPASFAAAPVFQAAFQPESFAPAPDFGSSFEPAASFAASSPFEAPQSFAPVPQSDPLPPPPAPQKEIIMHDDQLQSPDGLVSDEAVSEIANSFGTLVRSVSAERAASIGRPGITIEDIVREEVKPVLKAWLDTHLPSMVERMVRAEINRVLERAQG